MRVFSYFNTVGRFSGAKDKDHSAFRNTLSFFLLVFVLFGFARHVNAATYYVDSVNGSDSNTGLSTSLSWQTLAKVKKASLLPGDSVLFKRGDDFRSDDIYYTDTSNRMWILTQSGTPNNPITFGAYGNPSDALPVIDALSLFNDVNNWSNYSGNIWKYSYMYGGELLNNANFGSWSNNLPTQWTVQGNLTTTQETLNSPSGGTYIKIVNNSNWSRLFQTVNVVPGQWYRYSMYVKTDVGSADLSVYAGDVAIINSYYKSYPNWTKIESEFRAPPGVTSVQVRLYAKDVGDTAYFDSLSLKKSSGVTQLKRVFINGTAVGEAANRDSVNSSKKHYWDSINKDLYVYSAGGNPATQYTTPGVEGTKTFAPLVTRASYVNIHDLEFKGGFNSAISLQKSLQKKDENGIVISNSKMTKFGTNGIEIEGVQNSIINNNYLNKYWQASENPVVEFGGDGIGFYAGANRNTVSNNVLIGCGHSLINLTGRNWFKSVEYNIIENNDLSAPVSSYCRGLGVAGAEGKTQYNIIRNNYIHDTSVRNQPNGNNNSYYGNIIFSVRGTSNFGNVRGEGIQSRTWIRNGQPYVNHDNTISNNTIIHAKDIGLTLFPSSNVSMYNDSLVNNLVYGSGIADGYSQMLINNKYASIVHSTVTNNLLYSANSVKNVISYYGKMYNATQFNNGVAVNNDVISGNLTKDPMFSSSAMLSVLDARLKPLSPAIDAGTYAGIKTDFAGNPIYGAPDIGAYEYQPPYTFSNNNIPTTGSIRLYTNGKYRMTSAASSASKAVFSVTPVGGVYVASTSEYMDISIKKWTASDKQWIATSTSGQFNTHATSTVYTLGDLTPKEYYTFYLDGVASSTAISDNSQCTSSVCRADSSGKLTFTYVGGYSTHIFDISIPTTSPSAFTLSGPTKVTMSSNSDLSWKPSYSNVHIQKYRLYVDGVLTEDNLSPTVTSTKLTKTYVCNKPHTWKIEAVDNNGKTTSSDNHTFTISCTVSSSVNTSSSYTPAVQKVAKKVASTSVMSLTKVIQPTTTSTQSNVTKTKGGLNEIQISAIISLLRSFGVDEKVIENVRYALTGVTVHTTRKFYFKRNLAMYHTGLQVKLLQQFLNDRGFTVSSTGPGSLGAETEYFGRKTYRALVRYQRKERLPDTGWFGPMTRATIK